MALSFFLWEHPESNTLEQVQNEWDKLQCKISNCPTHVRTAYNLCLLLMKSSQLDGPNDPDAKRLFNLAEGEISALKDPTHEFDIPTAYHSILLVRNLVRYIGSETATSNCQFCQVYRNEQVWKDLLGTNTPRSLSELDLETAEKAVANFPCFGINKQNVPAMLVWYSCMLIKLQIISPEILDPPPTAAKLLNKERTQLMFCAALSHFYRDYPALGNNDDLVLLAYWPAINPNFQATLRRWVCTAPGIEHYQELCTRFRHPDQTIIQLALILAALLRYEPETLDDKQTSISMADVDNMAHGRAPTSDAAFLSVIMNSLLHFVLDTKEVTAAMICGSFGFNFSESPSHEFNASMCEYWTGRFNKKSHDDSYPRRERRFDFSPL